MYQGSVSDKNYLQETRLHALGYQISDLNSEDRWNIIKFVAIPMLGAKEVVRTIMAVISSRIARPANADKFRFAIKEWNRDLNAIGKLPGGELGFLPVDQNLKERSTLAKIKTAVTTGISNATEKVGLGRFDQALIANNP